MFHLIISQMQATPVERYPQQTSLRTYWLISLMTTATNLRLHTASFWVLTAVAGT